MIRIKQKLYFNKIHMIIYNYLFHRFDFTFKNRNKNLLNFIKRKKNVRKK